MSYRFSWLVQYRLPKTPVTQTGMTNRWLASQGLLSVRDLRIKAHGYA